MEISDGAQYSRLWRRMAEIGDPEPVKQEALRRYGPVNWDDPEDVKRFHSLKKEVHQELEAQQPRRSTTERSPEMEVLYREDGQETLVVRRDGIGCVCLCPGDDIYYYLDYHFDVLCVRIIGSTREEAAAILERMARDYDCPDLSRAAWRVRRDAVKRLPRHPAFRDLRPLDTPRPHLN